MRKNIVFYSFFFFLSFFKVNAQITAIPDVNFEQALIDLNYDDVIDGGVLTTNIENITALNLTSKNISDLTGIQDFISLTDFSCASNSIQEIDIANLPLIQLYAPNNDLRIVNLRYTSAQTLLFCNLSNNPNLTCVQTLPNASIGAWSLDVQTQLSTHCYDTFIPDDNFEQAFIDLGLDFVLDDYVLTHRIDSITNINIENRNISDLTGIEDVIALETLNCTTNNLATIDLSSNQNLTNLDAHNNQLTSAVLPNSLTTFIANANQFSELDFSTLSALETLNLDDNPNLTELNLKNGNITAITSFSALNNSNLTCIEVDDPIYALNPINDWEFDETTTFKVDCFYDFTYVSDANFEQALIDLGLDDILNNYVLTSTLESITSLDVSSKNISNLTGIKSCVNLEVLNVSDNFLSIIDVTQNTLLKELYCADNYLASIDLSTLIYLTKLDVSDNSIVSFDGTANILLEEVNLSFNPSLSTVNLMNNTEITSLNLKLTGVQNLDVSNLINLVFLDTSICNSLTTINLQNGANEALTNFTSLNSPNLTCILVDDIRDAFNETGVYGIWERESQAKYSLLCGYTYVPDINFKNRIHQIVNANDGIANFVNTSYIENIQELNINFLDVADFTGIEDFTELKVLINDTNDEIEELNLVKNTKLETVALPRAVKLKKVDLSANPLLDIAFFRDCANLEDLNLKNGNNQALNFVVGFDECPKLKCIEVDDPVSANQGMGVYSSWLKDVHQVFSTNCNAVVDTKVYLQGAALNPISGEEHLMRDDLRVLNLIPTTSPYEDLLVCDVTVFSTTGTNAIVDWVYLELREASDNSELHIGKSALLQRDGDIVSVDGVTPVNFKTAMGDYYLVIKHRNHLGIISNDTKSLSDIATTINFKDANVIINAGVDAQTTFGMPNGVIGMWSGNVNGDMIIQYSGTAPDAPTILSSVLNDTDNFLNLPTFSMSGYNSRDLNLDGTTQYSGTNPDTPIILQNVLAHPGNFLNFSTYQITEQLPGN